MTNKKKKNYFLLPLLLILIFLLLNFKNLLFYFNSFVGNYFYDKGDFISAQLFHNKAIKEIDNGLSNYNLSNSLYKYENYKQSIEYLEKIETDDNDLNFRKFYNLGNNYYRLWELIGDKSYLLKSIENYRKSIDIKNDKEAIENYEFVKSKLDELENKAEEQEEEQTEDNNTNEETEKNQKDEEEQNEEQENGDNSEDGKNEPNNQGESQESTGDNDSESNDEIIQNSRPDEYILGEGDEVPKITDNELNKIENYIDYLENEEKSNQRFFNKKQNDSMFDMFNFPGFFDTNSTEKDW